MKTILTRLTDIQVQKEIKYLPAIAAIATIIPLFMFGFVAIAGLAFSGRGVLLTYHKGLKADPNLVWYRILFAICAIISLVEVVLYIAK